MPVVDGLVPGTPLLQDEDEVDEETTNEQKKTERKQRGKTPKTSDEVRQSESENEALPPKRATSRQQNAPNKAGSARSTAKSNNSSSKNIEVVIDSSEDDADEAPALSGLNQVRKSSGRASGAARATKSQLEDEDLEEDGKSESEFSGDDFEHDSDVEVNATRRPSRHPAPARSTKRRDSQPEKHADSDDDDEPEETKKKAAAGKGRTTGSKRGKSAIIQKILASDDHSDSSIEAEVEEKSSTAVKKDTSSSGKRKSLSSTPDEKKKPRKRGRTSATGNSDEKPNLSASKTKKETPGRHQVASMTQPKHNILDENSSGMLNTEGKGVKSSSSVKATKQRKGTRQVKNSNSDLTFDDDSSNDEAMESPVKKSETKHGKVVTTAPSTSSRGVKSPSSPFRSRRKKSPATKKVKSPAKVLDLTSDGDDFGFLS